MFTVRSTDGVKIAVYDYNPRGGQTVFLVHGWPLSHKMYEYQIGPLTKRGYRVVAVDLRGFGESDTPACGYSYNQMAADVHGVVRALGLCRFTLVGFSMGGAIALRYMRLFRGEGVKRLILLSAAAPSWTRRPGFPYGLTRESVDNLIAQAASDRACWPTPSATISCSPALSRRPLRTGLWTSPCPRRGWGRCRRPCPCATRTAGRISPACTCLP